MVSSYCFGMSHECFRNLVAAGMFQNKGVLWDPPKVGKTQHELHTFQTPGFPKVFRSDEGKALIS